MIKRMLKIKGALLGWLLLFTTIVQAQSQLEDPTRPSGWQAVPAQVETATEIPVRLDSILLSPQRRIAVINGHALAEGESRDGMTLVKVAEREALVRVGGQTRTVRLESPVGIRR